MYYDADLLHKPLAHKLNPKCHIQTAWIRMRRRVTLRLIRIQAVLTPRQYFHQL